MIAIYIIQITMATVSTMASSAMAVMVSRISAKGLRDPKNRVLFTMAVSDILQSICLIASPFVLYDDGRDNPPTWTFGSETLCDVQGFLIVFAVHFSIPAIFFHCFISYLRAAKGVSDSHFHKKYERLFYPIVLIHALVMCSLLQRYKNYNMVSGYTSNYCALAIGWYPSDCQEGEPNCKRRGEDSYKALVTSDLLVGALYLFGAIYCLYGLYNHTRFMNRGNIRIFRQSLVLEPTTLDGVDSENPAITENRIHPFRIMMKIFTTFWKTCKRLLICQKDQHLDTVQRLPRTRQEERRLKSTKKVRVQCILYALAFGTVYFTPMMSSMINGYIGRSYPVWVAAIIAISSPSQGILNLIIFTRPNVVVVKERYPEAPRIRVFYEVILAGNKVPEKYRRRNRTSTTLREIQREGDFRSDQSRV